uniref:Uncharacterized protein LOC108038560 n=1 Tax=Drosophila rhopaloa TaxID=1041015 RepID=A0A6P4E366_DRORH
MTLAVNGCCNTSLKAVPKRSIVLEDHVPWTRVSGARILNGGPWNQGWSASIGFGPTPSEVSNAISVARQASANFAVAQQQLQAAKENVLNQQRIATEKQTQAVILKQKSQAAVAHAAAHAAAAEIQKSELEAAKLSHFTRIAHPSAGHHISSLTSANNHLSISNLEPIGFGSWLDSQGNIPGKPVNDWY